jgi:hypothetical protein
VAELRTIQSLEAEQIEYQLKAEPLPVDALGDLRGQDLVMATTANRSVLGCMNDMASMPENFVERSGGGAHRHRRVEPSASSQYQQCSRIRTTDRPFAKRISALG